MNTKLIKAILILLETILTLSLIAICTYGLINKPNTDSFVRYAETLFRCLSIYIFSIVYFTSLTSSSGSDSLFIPFYLLSFVVSEIRILDTFAKDFSLVLVPPMTGVTILLSSVFLMGLSLIGYGLFYDNRNSAEISRFQLFSLGGCVLVAMLLPKVTNYFDVLELAPVRTIMTVLVIISALVFIILIIQDRHSSDVVRHIAAILLIAGNYTNLFFDSFIMNLSATIFTFVGLVIITILAKINEVKF